VIKIIDGGCAGTYGKIKQGKTVRKTKGARERKRISSTAQLDATPSTVRTNAAWPRMDFLPSCTPLLMTSAESFDLLFGIDSSVMVDAAFIQ